MKSRFSMVLPRVAMAIFAIASAQAAPPLPQPPSAQTTERASIAARHLGAMDARMKLMQGQMRRIQEATNPEVREKLLREHMHTMMEQMHAMRAMGGQMMLLGMMDGRSMGHGMVGGGNRNAPSAQQCQRMRDRMRDHMQSRLDIMQMMMEQMIGQMQVMQGMPMAGKGPQRSPSGSTGRPRRNSRAGS